MRTVLLAATLLLAFGSIESRMTLAQLRNTVKGMKKVCTSKIAVSAEILEGASNGIYPPDPALQCYYKCIFEMMKLMKNDKLLIDVMIKQLDKMVALDVLDRMKETTLKCAEAIDSEDPCVLSWQFTKCFYETDSSVAFFP